MTQNINNPHRGHPTATEGQPKAISEFGQDGSTVVITDGTITIYDKSLKAVSSFPLKYTPTSLGASSTNEIAVGGHDNTIHIHTLHGSTIAETKKIITRATATALSYSPTGSYLAAGDSTGKITLYDTAGGAYSVKTTRWAFHTARVQSIVWNEKGSHVVTGSLDTNVFVYSVENPAKNVKVRNAHMGGVNVVGWEGEDTIVSAGADGAVKRWSVTLAG